MFGTPLGLDLAAVAKAAAVDGVTVVDDVTGLVAALDDATARAACASIVAKVGDREAEAALLRDVQADVSAALRELESEDDGSAADADDDPE